MAEVRVEKPTDEELKKLNIEKWGIWEKEVSDFDWEYMGSETFYVLQGKARVETPSGEVEFKAGDLVTFPAGMKCTWHVLESIKKRYTFSLER